MDGTLEDRLAALERAVTDGDHDCSALADGAATADRVAEIEADLADLTDRVAELEAATQALRGYVGNVRSVNTDVEQRADLALSKAEAARRAVDAHDGDRERCTHCERPFEDERGDDRGTDRSGIDTPGVDADQTGVDAGPAGLDALREPTDARADELGAVAGTQTDGGRPDPTTDTAGRTLPERTDEEPDGGVLSRVRSLL